MKQAASFCVLNGSRFGNAVTPIRLNLLAHYLLGLDLLSFYLCGIRLAIRRLRRSI